MAQLATLSGKPAEDPAAEQAQGALEAPASGEAAFRAEKETSPLRGVFKPLWDGLRTMNYTFGRSAEF